MPMLDLPLAELRQYTGTTPKPSDFDEYWAEALAELSTVDAALTLTPAAFSAAGASCFDLTFTGVRGARIYAKYLRPATPGPHPCVLLFHGYTGSSGDWAEKLAWVSQGYCVAALDCRGQGGRSQDIGGVTGNTHKGHIIRGLEDGPQNLLFRHIFLDTVQLARLVSGFDEVDPARLATVGGSQGGALSVACSALHGGIKLTVSQYPFLSDFRRVWLLDLGTLAYSELFEWFRHFDPCHEREDEVFRSLAYLDVHHLAPRVKNPALMALTLMDTTCPPSTQFAVYNCLGGEKQMKLYPDFGHEALPGWADTVFDALKYL